MKKYKYTVNHDSKRIDSINVFLNKGKFTIALREVKKYMEDYPNDDLGSLVYAECLLRMTSQNLGSSLNGQEIEDICLKLINKESKFQGASWCLLGRLREMEMDYEEAERCFRNAVSLGDERAKSFFVSSLLRNRKSQEALEVMASIGVEDNYPEIILLKNAIALHSLGKDKEALQVMSDIDSSQFNEKQKQRYFRTKARIYLAMDRIAEAKEILLESIKSLPNYQEEHVILVRCYIREKNLEEAYLLCNKLVKSFSGEYRDYAVCYLGKIYELMGYIEKSREVYSVISLKDSRLSNKTKNILYFNLGQLEICDRNYEKAIEYFEKVDSVNERDISNKKLFLVISYIRLGNIEKAKEIFESIDDSSCMSNNTILYQKVKNVLLYSQKLPFEINSYFDLQLSDYQRKRLLYHCAKSHRKSEQQSVFKEDINLNHLVDEVGEFIKSSPVIESNVNDKYLIYYKDIGYCDGVSTDYMEVVVLGGTNKILTMYPVTHVTLEEVLENTSYESKSKQKSKSRIERFYAKYGQKR